MYCPLLVQLRHVIVRGPCWWLTTHTCFDDIVKYWLVVSHTWRDDMVFIDWHCHCSTDLTWNSVHGDIVLMAICYGIDWRRCWRVRWWPFDAMTSGDIYIEWWPHWLLMTTDGSTNLTHWWRRDSGDLIKWIYFTLPFNHDFVLAGIDIRELTDVIHWCLIPQIVTDDPVHLIQFIGVVDFEWWYSRSFPQLTFGDSRLHIVGPIPFGGTHFIFLHYFILLIPILHTHIIQLSLHFLLYLFTFYILHLFILLVVCLYHSESEPAFIQAVTDVRPDGNERADVTDPVTVGLRDDVTGGIALRRERD